MDIELLVLDVDGTLTDGGVYYDGTGNEFKKFTVRDGAGLMLAHTAGLKVMICTGRECEATTRRATEMHIEYLMQHVSDKRAFLQQFMAEHGLSRKNVAYCGDDLNDLGAMGLCGFAACPQNACPEVLAAADYICPQKGGEGAVRGAVEKILKDAGLYAETVQKAFGTAV